jgi:hypothetical protein
MHVEICRGGTRRGIMWIRREFRRQNEKSICPLCRKVKEWRDMSKCEGICRNKNLEDSVMQQ